MLQFTELQTGSKLWIAPQQVSAIATQRQGESFVCVLLMAGGFELQLQETAEDVSSQISKRLNAY